MTSMVQIKADSPAPFAVLSLAEFLRRPPPRKRFGGWRLDEEGLCVFWRDEQDRELYWIPLERCRTSAAVLDWIIQISKKTWAADAVVAGLVRILDDTLDLQPRLCSLGLERGPIDVRGLLRRRARR